MTNFKVPVTTIFKNAREFGSSSCNKMPFDKFQKRVCVGNFCMSWGKNTVPHARSPDSLRSPCFPRSPASHHFSSSPCSPGSIRFALQAHRSCLAPEALLPDSPLFSAPSCSPGCSGVPLLARVDSFHRLPKLTLIQALPRLPSLTRFPSPLAPQAA